MEAVEALALVAGHVDEELLLRNEYLAAENEILRSKLSRRPQLTNPERILLAKLGKQLGLKALKDVAAIVKPETVLAWYRKLVAKKFDGSARRRKTGRPRVDDEVEKLVLRMVEENPTWGYDRVAGALSNLGHDLSDETVGNILKRNGVPPAPRRKPDIPWSEFIERHQDVIAACDFFTTEVLTPMGLMTYYVLFFIKIGSREVHIAGVTGVNYFCRWTPTTSAAVVDSPGLKLEGVSTGGVLHVRLLFLLARRPWVAGRFAFSWASAVR